jgi:glutathione-regulated potassium-efflux system ancillary protein KefC
VEFAEKVGTKIFGLYPIIGTFRDERKERWCYTLMMSTGLIFGTISALFSLTHGGSSLRSRTRTWWPS